MNADEIRAWTTRQLVTRSAYYADPTAEQLALARAKAARKAAAQQRYRDRLKEKKP